MDNQKQRGLNRLVGRHRIKVLQPLLCHPIATPTVEILGTIRGCSIHGGSASGIPKDYPKGILILAKSANGKIFKTKSSEAGDFELKVTAVESGIEYEVTIFNGTWPRQKVVTVFQNKFTDLPNELCERRDIPNPPDPTPKLTLPKLP